MKEEEEERREGTEGGERATEGLPVSAGCRRLVAVPVAGAGIQAEDRAIRPDDSNEQATSCVHVCAESVIRVGVRGHVCECSVHVFGRVEVCI